MSLTTFLDNKDVRAWFSQEFIKPKFDLKKEVLAPPITRHYGLVGTAFDYLLRFYLEHLNPGAITFRWVAEDALNEMRGSGLARTQGAIVEIDSNLLSKGEDIILQAKTCHSNYVRSGQLSDELVRSALLLAQLDTYFRAGIVDESFGAADEGDVIDLKKLISLVSPDLMRAKKLCILNPKFGEASELVGGADADLLIDNMLIDIKTTSRLEVKKDDFNQLVGYYILFRIGGIDGVPFEHKVETLGIYSSRYAELLAFPVAAVVDEGKTQSIIEWFSNKVSERFAP